MLFLRWDFHEEIFAVSFNSYHEVKEVIIFASPINFPTEFFIHL